ncbi:myosin-binding protein 7-like [Neltuma alba]|uniref:myosin-binding protein 7-like n=1 Tax=Neltuma alba TaxID=207710 RepID=UPI0010A377E6|nr:myosin-binding protein 7-like [Prosopis alba]XP_028793997.1 myosin-binding protein 7-like [Prosopis alba]XP_028793998.1 myosin-binding protein 7-like [Prosopis alba]
MTETGISSGMAEVDIKALKETLCAQQQLLQNLYAELDQEREASATAASEALDMILRLQGEKAAVKMEANHYKRMAEEKIGHAEAALEFFEELMNQKDMEMASLEFQVQAYKRKLVSLGCDLNTIELDLPEQNGETSQSSNLRRLSSLPPIPFKNSLRANLKMARSPSLVLDTKMEQIAEQEGTAQSLDSASKSGDIAYGNGTLNSYWNQIKRLDEKVKVMSNMKQCEEGKAVNLENRRWNSCSTFSQGSRITCDQPDTVSSTSLVSNFYDVFDIPQPHENLKVRECWKRALAKLNAEAGNRVTIPDSVFGGTVESVVQHKPDSLDSRLGTNNDIQITSAKDDVNVTDQKEEATNADCNTQAELQKLYQRIERLERERTSVREEIEPEENESEQLRLLKEIHSQLRLIQSEIRSWKTKKATPKDDVSFARLQEAMLHFWL